ncbi:hypothetical protein [Flavobacterium sp. WC2430]|uniref:hypothetical protein n=1 Tax=Flavobacterium sp. WC2430 TaxID=3234137 RepID=UPI0034664564
MQRIILERNLDFKQFQNLFILTFSCLITLFAMLYSLRSNEFVYIKLGLFAFSLIFILVMFTKKGLVVKKNELYNGVFLFEKLTYKKAIKSDFKIVTVFKGRLSTNYNYSYDIKEFHNWEPDLNATVVSFTLNLLNQNHTKKIKVITLTKVDKTKIAVDFILANTSLKFEIFNPVFN